MKSALKVYALPALMLTLLSAGALFIFSKPGDPKPDKPNFDVLPAASMVPSSLDFCGEKVPLDDPEVLERFEREFMLNVYDHATITMVLKRLNRWKGPMLEILKANGIPEDFIYLMVAESAVRNARSLAGAQGYWQFMPQTAREYKLRLDQYVDERNHPLKSTKAACKYLNASYKEFGNWTLSAASYNMGAGAVNYNMKTQGQKSYHDLYMNQETSRYIFRILAYKEILSNPEKYGYVVPTNARYKQLVYKKISTKKSIDDLIKFAHQQGVTFKTLIWYNPWLLRYELPINDGKTYELWIPIANPKLPTFVPPDDEGESPPDSVK